MSRLFAISAINLASEVCWLGLILFTIQLIGLTNYGGIQYQLSLLSLLFSVISCLPNWWPKITDLKYGSYTVSLLLVIHFVTCFSLIILWVFLLDDHEYIDVVIILGIALSISSIFAGFNALYYGIGQSRRVLIMAILKFFSRMVPCVVFLVMDSPDIVFVVSVFLVFNVISFGVDAFFFCAVFQKMFPNFFENLFYAGSNLKLIIVNFWSLFLSVKFLQLIPKLRAFVPILLANKFVGGDAVAIIKLGQSAFSIIALIGKPYRSFAFANTNHVFSNSNHFFIIICTLTIFILVDFLPFDNLVLLLNKLPFSLEQLVFILKYGCVAILSIIMAPLRGRISRLRTRQYVSAEVYLFVYYGVASSICISAEYTFMPLVILSYTLLAFVYFRKI